MPVADQSPHSVGIPRRQIHLVPAIVVIDENQIPGSVVIPGHGIADGRELRHSGRAHTNPLAPLESRHDHPLPTLADLTGAGGHTPADWAR